MDQKNGRQTEQKNETDRSLSDKNAAEEANIDLDNEFYEDKDTEKIKETTVPFINRNQS